MGNGKIEIRDIRLEPAENGLVLQFTEYTPGNRNSDSIWKPHQKVYAFTGNDAKDNKVKTEAINDMVKLQKGKMNNPLTTKDWNSLFGSISGLVSGQMSGDPAGRVIGQDSRGSGNRKTAAQINY